MQKRIVIKLGGASLFRTGGFQLQLQHLLEEFQDQKVYLIAGGGDLVESMRTLHGIYPELNHAEMHWRCIRLLDHTWSIASNLFPLASAIGNAEELRLFQHIDTKPNASWIRVQSFYSESLCELLPVEWQPRLSWSTTSDAIAWLLGKIVGAERVVLLKQCEWDSKQTLSHAESLQVVDSETARLSAQNGLWEPKIEIRTLSPRG